MKYLQFVGVIIFTDFTSYSFKVYLSFRESISEQKTLLRYDNFTFIYICPFRKIHIDAYDIAMIHRDVTK